MVCLDLNLVCRSAKIRFPLLESLDDCYQLFIVDLVIERRPTKFLRKECNRVDPSVSVSLPKLSSDREV